MAPTFKKYNKLVLPNWTVFDHSWNTSEYSLWQTIVLNSVVLKYALEKIYVVCIVQNPDS